MRAQALFAGVLEPFGRLDIVINNAGVSVFTPTTDIDEADDDRVIDTKARGTFFALQETARHGADGGRIINLAAVPPGPLTLQPSGDHTVRVDLEPPCAAVASPPPCSAPFALWA